MTVEIGYALFSAAFASALVSGAVVGPALLFDLPGPVEKAQFAAGTVLACALFTLRVVSVLTRFRQGVQPSQPGRTNPDS